MFLRDDYIIDRMKKYRHKWLKSYEIRLTTNGLLYGDSKVQNFICKYKSNLSISISIDGNKDKNDINRVFRDGAGSYNLIIDNVNLWIKQFPNEGTKMTISHKDIPYIYDSLKHLIGLGIKRIDVNPIVEDVWENGDDISFQEQLVMFADYVIDNNLWNKLQISVFDDFIGHPIGPQQKLAPCGTMSLSVTPDGCLYSCIRFAAYSLRYKKAMSIGNIYDGIDKNKIRSMDLYYNDVVSPDKCLTCEVASGCKWCPAESYDTSNYGSAYVRTTYGCEMHKAKVKAKNYFYNKLRVIGIYNDKY